jgi:putative membrane protein
MKLVSVFAAVIGLAVIAGLVIHFGAGAVIHSLLTLGARGFATVCFLQLLVIAVMGIAWWVLLPGTSAWAGIWGRLVRDSASEVLPLSQVGGYLLGARALALCGVSGNRAAASTIVDVTLEFFAQLAYTAIALAWLLHLDPQTRFAAPTGFGLVVACGLAGGCLVAQRRGFRLLDRFAGALGRGWVERTAAGAAALHDAIAEIYTRLAAVWGSLVLHLACWVASAAEIWLALRLMKAPLGFGVVLVIESLLYAIRSVAFAVPNAVGVQEGAYILLGAGFGLTPEAALALSLLKRGRDFAIGLPALGAYQLIESGRLWRHAAKAGASSANPFPVVSKTPVAMTGVSAPAPEERAGPSHRLRQDHQGDITMQADDERFYTKLQ